ncbi:MAG TPA: hypothetical protein VMQ59_13235 [Acidimicrobiales bacterium]|nr:hypothetical protein [Acidimicrobiales bacterium]
MGADPRLDPDLCEICYQVVRPNEARLRSSGMFAPAVPVAEEADAVTRLLALLGRDPAWPAEHPHRPTGWGRGSARKGGSPHHRHAIA